MLLVSRRYGMWDDLEPITPGGPSFDTTIQSIISQLFEEPTTSAEDAYAHQPQVLDDISDSAVYIAEPSNALEMETATSYSDPLTHAPRKSSIPLPITNTALIPEDDGERSLDSVQGGNVNWLPTYDTDPGPAFTEPFQSTEPISSPTFDFLNPPMAQTVQSTWYYPQAAAEAPLSRGLPAEAGIQEQAIEYPQDDWRHTQLPSAGSSWNASDLLPGVYDPQCASPETSQPWASSSKISNLLPTPEPSPSRLVFSPPLESETNSQVESQAGPSRTRAKRIPAGERKLKKPTEGKKRVRCDICRKYLGRSQELQRHNMVIHAKEYGAQEAAHSSEMLECSQLGCSTQFVRRDKVWEHERKVHNFHREGCGCGECKADGKGKGKKSG
ncbi:hypothetical protein HWV62_18438 [Athelia sp. TMB]|nr:hypothetical protein HWV62_18438 [Athelia sp. TMB]